MSIHGAERGVAIVQKWSLDMLFHLDPRRQGLQNAFLGNFLNAIKLGIRLHAQSSSFVEGHMEYAPCMAVARRDFRPHPDFWIGQRYTIPELASFLCGDGDVRNGVDFLQYVVVHCDAHEPTFTLHRILVERRIPLDFTTLCDFVDKLAGIFITTRLQITRGSLQNIVLPRSWLIELWPAFSRFQRHNTATTDRVLRVLQRLLGDVYRGELRPSQERSLLDALAMTQAQSRWKMWPIAQPR